MTKVIIASVIMASVTYGKCYLWQKYYGKWNWAKKSGEEKIDRQTDRSNK